MTYFAHSENKAGYKELVSNHLFETSKLAGSFAMMWGRREEAEAAALCHDLGKYTELFNKVLVREAIKIDHATPGALVLIKQYNLRGLAAAIAVQGHHDGLVLGIPRELEASVKMKEEVSNCGKTYSSREPDTLLRMLDGEGLRLPLDIDSDYPERYKANHCIAAMLYVRMLFSALVDADFLATEAHFNSSIENAYEYRKDGKPLQPAILFSLLQKHVENLRIKTKASITIKNIRNELYDECIMAGSLKRGIYTLTAPTGSGKTLAMLAFALRHAQLHNFRRIIIVLPYLNIIEQSVNVYRGVFNDNKDTDLILEDHSLAELPEDIRLLAENWDAPIVVTTTVRFFEGLFASRSSACRRLHNISNSVILFDEAQSIPQKLATYTLASMSYLVERFACTTVFCTATQPAFDFFHHSVKNHTSLGWQPESLIKSSDELAKKARRVNVQWYGSIEWEYIAERLKHKRQALTILNTKNQAKRLYLLLCESTPDEQNFHLSTDMCPAHRLYILARIKKLLESNMQCRLVSTQCIEAGVDIDFPAVWRALAPLEAICQAAGRCNREGKLNYGELHVFRPPLEDEFFPDDSYQKAALEVQLMLAEKGNLDIDDTLTLREYFCRYYRQSAYKADSGKLADAIKSYDFHAVAENYNWISQNTINILVPYLEKIESFKRLTEIARKGKISREWLKEARSIAVSHRFDPKSAIMNVLEPIIHKNEEKTGWYILLDHKAYCPKLGFNPSDVGDIYISK